MQKYIRNQSRVKIYRLHAEGPGRPASYGFTPSDVVSSVMELELRRLGSVPGATRAAVLHVKNVFVDLQGENAERTIYRDWAKSKTLVRALSTADLLDIIKPYEVKLRRH